MKTMTELHTRMTNLFEDLLHEDGLNEIQAAYKLPEEFARDINTPDDKARFYAVLFVNLFERRLNPVPMLRDVLVNPDTFELLTAQGHALQNLIGSFQQAFCEVSPATKRDIRAFIQPYIQSPKTV